MRAPAPRPAAAPGGALAPGTTPPDPAPAGTSPSGHVAGRTAPSGQATAAPMETPQRGTGLELAELRRDVAGRTVVPGLTLRLSLIHI